MVAGEVNPADLFTKHLESQAKPDQVVGLFGCQFMTGRAASAPALKSDLAVEVHLARGPAALPYLHLPENIAELFQEARPASPMGARTIWTRQKGSRTRCLASEPIEQPRYKDIDDIKRRSWRSSPSGELKPTPT